MLWQLENAVSAKGVIRPDSPVRANESFGRINHLRE